MANTSTKILVVDDDRLIRRLLRSGLSSRGFSVVEAENGASALAVAKDQPPDLIVLDLGLPDLSGLDLLRRFREDSNIPIVVLSNTDAVRVKVEALEAGASDFVTKPFNVDESRRGCVWRCGIACNNKARTRSSAMAISSSTW